MQPIVLFKKPLTKHLYAVLNQPNVFNQSKIITPFIVSALLIGCGSSDPSMSDRAKKDGAKTASEVTAQASATVNLDQETKSTTDSYTDGLKLMAYNVYLMNGMLSQWQQDKRAEFILQSESIKGHDVVILNELFDDQSSKVLLDGLKKEYPHQTPILARSYTEEEKANGDAGTNIQWDQRLGNIDKKGFEDGGVAIISRWPIKEQVEYVYKEGCGTDNLGRKGFVYAVIDKNGKDYHVIGTHAQSEDKNCDAGEPANVRESQFTELQQFITAKKIPKDKILFIGGDFNVIKSSEEYPKALETLRVNAPDVYAGFDTSWDPESNGIASANYPDDKREYLDYVFVSKDHAQPTYWHNQSIDELSPRWENKGRQFEELSDHYPIAGFAYADANTRTKSHRFTNRPYANIKLRNHCNDTYLTTSDNGKSIDGGKLLLNGFADSTGNRFNLDNWYPKSQAFCIKNNDNVQLQSKLASGGYWGSLEDASQAMIRKKSSKDLRIEILNDDGDCLKNGDKVVFSDVDSKTKKRGYYQASTLSGLILSSAGKASATALTIEMEEGKVQDWSSKLTYQ